MMRRSAQAKPASRPSGLHCPGCGKPAFRTLDSRPVHGGQKRRKICTSCDYRVITLETIIGTPRAVPVRNLEAAE